MAESLKTEESAPKSLCVLAVLAKERPQDIVKYEEEIKRTSRQLGAMGAGGFAALMAICRLDKVGP